MQDNVASFPNPRKNVQEWRDSTINQTVVDISSLSIIFTLILQGAHAGLAKSYTVFVFLFVRPYKVLFLGYFCPKGIIKSYFC